MKDRIPVELTLQTCTYPIIDGVERKTVTAETEAFADVVGVNRAEFYAADQAGYRADIIFELWAFEYGGQQGVLYDGREYKVIRSFPVSMDRVQITCQRMDGL